MTESTMPRVPKLSKGAQTALRIQVAAVDLVLRNGIDGTTVDQICRAANVSERTFFNYFKTKELAIIGDDLPQIDETRAREFLASPPGDIFSDAARLIPGPTMSPEHHALFFKRLEMNRKYPSLLAAHMDKLFAIKTEHTELIYLRLRRNYSGKMADTDIRHLANAISEIVAGLFRLEMERGLLSGAAPTPPNMQELGTALSQIVNLGLNA